ncbi:MAG: hypothetical protein GY874_01385 [Desulfobacteraceae bacterium]|nr:hypothetical protein [Desulfobacteraceae bacterium]
MDCRYNLNETGLTLLEAVIAMLVFSVGILSVLVMQDISALAITGAHKKMKNSISAGVFLESLYNLPFDDVRLEDIDEKFNPEKPDHGPVPVQNNSNATIEWEVQDNYSIENSKLIRVVIRWCDRGNVEKKMTYNFMKVKS